MFCLFGVSPTTIPAAVQSLGPTFGSLMLSTAAARLQPRYHIAGGVDVYYSRSPYTNTTSSHVTRFQSVASVKNTDKAKVLHELV